MLRGEVDERDRLRAQELLAIRRMAVMALEMPVVFSAP
jgi:hypothetical protein